MATEQNGNGYLISETLVTRMFVGSAVLMVMALFALFLIATARPQGRLNTNVNTAQHELTRDAALERLSGYGETDDGRLTIDIRRAMELIVERGLN